MTYFSQIIIPSHHPSHPRPTHSPVITHPSPTPIEDDGVREIVDFSTSPTPIEDDVDVGDDEIVDFSKIQKSDFHEFMNSIVNGTGLKCDFYEYTGCRVTLPGYESKKGRATSQHIQAELQTPQKTGKKIFWLKIKKNGWKELADDTWEDSKEVTKDSTDRTYKKRYFPNQMPKSELKKVFMKLKSDIESKIDKLPSTE